MINRWKIQAIGGNTIGISGYQNRTYIWYAVTEKVWKELVKIPAGQTRTYKELADLLGTHSRVIGNCCGANRIAVLIPCHRVVGANNKLTGYRWGKSYKEYLLKQEGIGI